jgi:hypothetical protein
MLVDGSLRGPERLRRDLTAEKAEPVGGFVLATEDVGVDLLEIQHVNQLVQRIPHALHGIDLPWLSGRCLL